MYTDALFIVTPIIHNNLQVSSRVESQPECQLKCNRAQQQDPVVEGLCEKRPVKDEDQSTLCRRRR